MFATSVQMKRPLLAALMVIGLGAGFAAAVDYYAGSPCGTPCATPAPYVVSSPCGTPCAAPAPAPVPYVAASPCNPCGNSSSINVGVASSYSSSRYYGNDYDYSYTARQPIGINYLIPTQHGLIESPVVPLTNPVDRYYATHVVRNGQVVDESASYQLALSFPYQNQGGMSSGVIAATTPASMPSTATYASTASSNAVPASTVPTSVESLPSRAMETSARTPVTSVSTPESTRTTTTVNNATGAARTTTTTTKRDVDGKTTTTKNSTDGKALKPLTPLSFPDEIDILEIDDIETF